jgi:hypothetical protein
MFVVLMFFVVQNCIFNYRGFFSVSEMISIIREKICVLLDKPDLSTTVKNTLEIDMKKPQLKLNHVKVKLSEKATAQIESCQGKVV